MAFKQALGEPFKSTEYNKYLPESDPDGHGTHTASTAGGSFVHNVSVGELSYNTARGGVDVLSLSRGFDIPLYPEIDKHDLVYYGSFHAVANGITVVCSAGNSGLKRY
ncbi:Subtilisin-like protease SBT3.5 [Abeliophyllum distichum]|uniref:Subtilisin-like protease SBT3.5 n=1 Tax=Abeliophyllum distichum TaxID=126358 RepID=A0ABD1URA9_9LAMI